ncbi:hypothetical protein T06_7500 [Trichinella sp. T6]|nr:hypothetical protein T06_7500 [Trichinella sp. T6]
MLLQNGYLKWNSKASYSFSLSLAFEFSACVRESLPMEGNSVCIYPKEPTKIGAQRKGMRDFPGKQYTNLDATQVIRTGEHADGC